MKDEKPSNSRAEEDAAKIEAAKLAAGIAPTPRVIEPTVGRIVHYWPHTSENLAGTEQPLAGIVTYVRGTRLVHLCVFDPRGVPRPRVDVVLLQPGDDKPEGSFAEWPARPVKAPPEAATA